MYVKLLSHRRHYCYSEATQRRLSLYEVIYVRFFSTLYDHLDPTRLTSNRRSEVRISDQMSNNNLVDY